MAMGMMRNRSGCKKFFLKVDTLLLIAKFASSSAFYYIFNQCNQGRFNRLRKSQLFSIFNDELLRFLSAIEKTPDQRKEDGTLTSIIIDKFVKVTFPNVSH